MSNDTTRAAGGLAIETGSVTVRVELYAGGQVLLELKGDQWSGFALIKRDDWNEIVRHVEW